MGPEADYYLDELEDLQVDEVVAMRDALARKFAELTLAAQHGETAELPSDECMQFLELYQNRLNERYDQYEDEAFALVELANTLFQTYMDKCQRKEISIEGILTAANQPTKEELGFDTQLLLLALENVAAESDLYLHVISSPTENSSHPEWATFVISSLPASNSRTAQTYDCVIEDMIEKIENEL